MGGFLIPGSPNHEDEFTFDGAASWDPYTAYDPSSTLHRNGEMKVRVRVFFLSMDNAPRRRSSRAGWTTRSASSATTGCASPGSASSSPTGRCSAR